jgi:hypothetical protein
MEAPLRQSDVSIAVLAVEVVGLIWGEQARLVSSRHFLSKAFTLAASDIAARK